MTWTVDLPARGAFTLQDDSGVGIQGNLGEGGTSEESNGLAFALVPYACPGWGRARFSQ